MNSPSNTIPQSHLASQEIAPAVISEARRMYWAVRRELWEVRSLYIAPALASALFLVAFVVHTLVLRHGMHGRWTLKPEQLHSMFTGPYEMAALLIMRTAVIVGIFYSLDALHGERRDRSILFWKSLPVSDRTTVLAKICIPLFLLPLLSFAIAVITQFIMLLLSSVFLLGSGLSVRALWTQVSFFHTSWMLLYHILTVHGLWYAPIYAWLLLVSAWARRAPFIWAFLPPFVICGVEKIAFNTSYIASILLYRVTGPEADVTMKPHPGAPMDLATTLIPHHFFITPGLWTGLALAAVFLAAAVRLRRYQGPI